MCLGGIVVGLERVKTAVEKYFGGSGVLVAVLMWKVHWMVGGKEERKRKRRGGRAKEGGEITGQQTQMS